MDNAREIIEKMERSKTPDDRIISDAHQASQILIALAGSQLPYSRLFGSHRVHVDGQLHRIKAIRDLLDKIEAEVKK